MRKLYGPEIMLKYPDYVTYPRKLDPIKVTVFVGGLFTVFKFVQYVKKMRK